MAVRRPTTEGDNESKGRPLMAFGGGGAEVAAMGLGRRCGGLSGDTITATPGTITQAHVVPVEGGVLAVP